MNFEFKSTFNNWIYGKIIGLKSNLSLTLLCVKVAVSLIVYWLYYHNYIIPAVYASTADESALILAKLCLMLWVVGIAYLIFKLACRFLITPGSGAITLRKILPNATAFTRRIISYNLALFRNTEARQ